MNPIESQNIDPDHSPTVNALREFYAELGSRNKYNNSPIIRSLAFRGRRHTLEDKFPIYQENQSCDNVYYLLSGMVKLSSYLPNGSSRIVRVCSSGTLFGLEATHRQKYLFYASTMTSCEIVAIPKHEVNSLKTNEPHNYCNLLETQFDIEQVNDKLYAEFTSGTIRARVARLLCYLITLYPDRNTLELICCDDIASMIGATIESVSRVLAEFKRSGVLQWIRGTHPPNYHYQINDLILCSLDDKHIYQKPIKEEKRKHRRGFLNTRAEVFIGEELLGTGTITDYSRNGLYLKLDPGIDINGNKDLLLKLRSTNSKRISKELKGHVTRLEKKGIAITLIKGSKTN